MNEFDVILIPGASLISLGLFLLAIVFISEKKKTSLIPIGFLLLNLGIDYLLHSGIVKPAFFVLIPDSISVVYLVLIIRYELKIRKILSNQNDSSSSTNTVV